MLPSRDRLLPCSKNGAEYTALVRSKFLYING